MRNQVLQGFVQETDPYGNAWYPLARTTVTDKIDRGVNNGILKETGQLAKSFQYRVLANGVRLFTNHVFEDGTDADIHQEGGIHPETGYAIPARPMVPDMGNLPPHWEDFIQRTLNDGLDRLFN
jgi:phage gpG-like protein